MSLENELLRSAWNNRLKPPNRSIHSLVGRGREDVISVHLGVKVRQQGQGKTRGDRGAEEKQD